MDESQMDDPMGWSDRQDMVELLRYGISTMGPLIQERFYCWSDR